MRTAQAGEAGVAVRVGVFLCVAQLSYVENIPEGPRGGGLLGLIRECRKTLCGVQRCGRRWRGARGRCWSPWVPERPLHRGRAHSPLPGAGFRRHAPVASAVGAAGEWARGTAFSQTPWGGPRCRRRRARDRRSVRQAAEGSLSETRSRT